MQPGGAEADDALLAAVGRGDPGAARTLLTAKLPRVLALAQRMLGDAVEAQDVAQDAFLRVWKQAPRWRPGQARFDTWLHRVALNLCYDRLRLRGRRETPMAEPPEQVDPSPSALGGLEAAERSRRVDAALQALPDRQRAAIVLSHYQGLGDGETAALLGVSVEAVESLLARGRRALRTALSDLREG